MRKIVFVILIFVVHFPVKSQHSDFGNWFIYFGNKQINKNWNWHNEVQYRNYNFVGDLEQLLVRTGIGYNLTENNNNILGGVGYILSQNYIANSDQKNEINEYRIYQQFITKQDIGIVNVQHRYRFEQRFIEDNFRLRFRYFLSLNIPLNKRQLEDRTFYFSAYNEIFLNTSGNFFDRNRLYGGLGYKLNRNVKIESGYMNQFLNTEDRDQLNLITFINF